MMNKNFNHLKMKSARHQEGATLFVTVILVLVLSIVALAVYQQATFDERNARAQADKALAIQAAEIALRDAEYDLQCQQFSTPTTPGVSSSVVPCDNGSVVVNRVNTTSSPGSLANDAQNTCRATCVPGSRLKIDRLLLGFDANGTNGLWAGIPDRPSSGIFGGFTNPRPWQNRQNWAPNSNTSVILGRYTGAPIFPVVSQQPRYLIEGFIDSERNLLFRITAKGWGRNPTTEVTLQQTYRP